jgi:RNA polymerase sigma-70 factor (ECF subfamily)
MGNGWEEVYQGQYRRLVALVAAVCGSLSDAEEAVQEAFVRALGLTGRRAVVDDPEGWLYRVAVNVLRSRWRRAGVARRAQSRLAQDHLATPGAGDESTSDRRLELLAALRTLPFEQREALALFYLVDLPIEAIAVRTATPVGTIKARLSRGRAALARALADDTLAPEEGANHV